MIYVTGSLAFDFIMDFPGKFSDQIVPDKLHLINISFLVNTLRESRGGTAGNIAYNLALLKKKSAIVACCGNDFAEYKKYLMDCGIVDNYIQAINDDLTARAFITTDLSDNQITGFYPGAMRQDKNLKLPSNASKSDFVVVSPTDPKAMENFTQEAIDKNIPFMFDFGMQLPRLNMNTLKLGYKNSQILIGNDYEIALFKKRLKIVKWEYFKKDQIIVTTLGSHGCMIETQNTTLKVPAVKVKKVVDPTGAGDAFRAGFLAGFTSGFNLLTCGRMGNLAAVYAVEKYGTMEHRFTVGEFEKRYWENYGEKLDLNVESRSKN